MSYSVVIPSRSIENLKHSIGSLKNEHPTWVFIAWDSTERYLEYEELDSLSKDLPIVLCDVPAPFVFSKSVNLGITAYPDNDIFIMNDDAVLEIPGTLDALAQCAVDNPDFGVIASSVTGAVGNAKQRRLTRGLNLREVQERLCFIAVYIRRDVINSVGLLNERFDGYGFEDDEYCDRVRSKGLKLGVYDGCIIEHEKVPSTFRTNNPKIHELVAHNRKIYSDICSNR